VRTFPSPALRRDFCESIGRFCANVLRALHKGGTISGLFCVESRRKTATTVTECRSFGMMRNILLSRTFPADSNSDAWRRPEYRFTALAGIKKLISCVSGTRTSPFIPIPRRRKYAFAPRVQPIRSEYRVGRRDKRQLTRPVAWWDEAAVAGKCGSFLLARHTTILSCACGSHDRTNGTGHPLKTCSGLSLLPSYGLLTFNSDNRVRGGRS
jgi:hypothetical protein